MSLTALSLILTVGVLAIHYQCPDTPVPQWIRLVLFDVIGRMLCMGAKRRTLVENCGQTRITLFKRNISIIKAIGGDQKKNNTQNGSLPPNDDYTGNAPEYKDTRAQKVNPEDWHLVGRIVDRLLLIMFALTIIISTVWFIGAANAGPPK